MNIPSIFTSVLYGQKDIFLEQNNRYMYLHGSTTCARHTSGISERADVGMTTDIKHFNITAFRFDASYIENDIEKNFEMFLNGKLEVYIRVGANNHIGGGEYISVCKKGNIVTSNELRDSRFILQVDGLTGNLMTDIERTFMGINTVYFKLKDKNKYIGIVGNNVELVENKNIGFKIHCFHPHKLNCCRNIGEENKCGKYWGKGDCDKLITNYCLLNFNKNSKECACFNSLLHPSVCFDKRCFDDNILKTEKMRNKKCSNVGSFTCQRYVLLNDVDKKNVINWDKLETNCYRTHKYGIKKEFSIFYFDKITSIIILFILLFAIIYSLLVNNA